MKCYFLNLRNDRLAEFNYTIEEHGTTARFGEAIKIQPGIASREGLIVFILTAENIITHIAQGKVSLYAATGQRRLNVWNILSLHSELSDTSRIISAAPTRLRNGMSRCIEFGGLASDFASKFLIKYFFERMQPPPNFLIDSNDTFIRSMEALTPETKKTLALQQEAVDTALALAGIDKRLIDLARPIDEITPNYLRSFGPIRNLEDRIIIDDMARSLPGFDSVNDAENISGVSRFVSDDTVMDVFIANKFPLERTLGVDLIYYNYSLKSFVFVQYKVMEEVTDDGDGSRDWVYRPNQQLADEISRMDALMENIDGVASIETTDSFRFSNKPFFLKLCERITFNIKKNLQTQGIYLPLEFWKLLVNDPAFIGPRGGVRVSRSKIRRGLSSKMFADIIRGAWVGTTPTQSGIIWPIIRSVTSSGKAIVLAIKKPR